MEYPSASNMINDISMERYGVTQSILNKYFRVNLERTKAVPIDYSALQQDKLFINWIYDQRAWEFATMEQNKRLIQPTKTLLESINKYLDE
ncbi:MAG: hypothetical protein ACJA1A_003880 [Saprospiraceae bacterium]|jgi:hypothetical protein